MQFNSVVNHHEKQKAPARNETCRAIGPASFDGSVNLSADKVLLQAKINHNNGQNAHYGACSRTLNVDFSRAKVLFDQQDNGVGFRLLQDIGRIEVGVPGRNSFHDNNGNRAGLQLRENNAHKGLQKPRAVDGRRLVKCRRDGSDKIGIHIIIG